MKKYKLKRDYINNPLKYGEYPEIEDIKYLYLDLNLIPSEVGNILGISKHKVSYCLKIFNIHKSKEQVQKSRSLFWKNSSEEYKQKRCQCIKKGFKDWTEQQRLAFKQRIKENLSKQTKESKNKRINAFKNTWSNRTDEQNEQRRNKIKEACKNRTKEQKQEIKEKFRKSYAKIWASKSVKEKQASIQKMQETKRKRGNLNTSKQEEIAFNLLNEKFPHQIKRQYKTEEYPFLCDFYIIPLNLYVEANFNWTPGKHPFDENNEEDIKTLKLWKNKSMHSDFFKVAINTWTKRDVKKLEYVKRNNLNFIALYSLEEFKVWVSKIN